ncbi:hypothetical protein GYMLUDRAFT_253222 [Collybiopsis luxurians FD-317 M1]|uniref:Unplaced genomic scaffold GYMLUscaffold_176, whole genome shotgun sequence n=1 Tax=Collybiopsis luxurians FD-317 M1 TaxID=944289 RepID=A0A0D0AJ25_9AGAR|nr:hypothetical protein GYMLUDRAFT_253222 [Collybiopsis luxurians FD-317 M1]
MHSTFNDLPPELWIAIGRYLRGDAFAVKQFAAVSARAFLLLNPILYEDIVSPNALAALAMEMDFRHWDSPHPASLVKTLCLDFQKLPQPSISNLHLLYATFQQAFTNILRFARSGSDGTTPALSVFLLKCHLSLDEIFQGVQFRPLHLEEVWL